MDLITAYLANKMSGGDSYTKAETDALLDGKADLVDGKVPLSEIPPAAIERMVTVSDDTARFALTTATVQLGDTVKVTSTNKMYMVVDVEHLDSEAGYQVYVAGRAAEAVADQYGNTIDTTYAPQSTTYTKGQVDTALAAKLNTADVDAALSSTSTNPVQNKVVQAPVARLVDAGAKNLAAIETSTPHVSNGVTFTASNGLINASGTASDSADAAFVVFGDKTLKPGNYCVSGCPSGGAIGKYRIDLVVDGNVYRDVGSDVSFTVASNASVRMQIVVYRGNSVNDLTFKPMLCTAEDYAISPEFVPYAPSNRELYELEAQVDINTRIVNIATWKSTVNVDIKPIETSPIQIVTFYMGGSQAGIYQFIVFGGNVEQISNQNGGITYTIDNNNRIITFSGPSTFMAYLEVKYL